MSLWEKASVKCINVNANVLYYILIPYDMSVINITINITIKKKNVCITHVSQNQLFTMLESHSSSRWSEYFSGRDCLFKEVKSQKIQSDFFFFFFYLWYQLYILNKLP